MVAAIEAEVARVLRIALIGCRTPIVTVLSGAFERPPFAPTRSGKEDAVTVRTCHLITVVASLRCPSPGAFIVQFFQFGLCRQTPAAAPVRTGCIVLAVAADIAKVFLVSLFTFRSCLSLGEITAVVTRRTGSHIAVGPLHTQPKSTYV